MNETRLTDEQAHNFHESVRELFQRTAEPEATGVHEGHEHCHVPGCPVCNEPAPAESLADTMRAMAQPNLVNRVATLENRATVAHRWLQDSTLQITTLFDALRTETNRRQLSEAAVAKLRTTVEEARQLFLTGGARGERMPPGHTFERAFARIDNISNSVGCLDEIVKQLGSVMEQSHKGYDNRMSEALRRIETHGKHLDSAFRQIGEAEERAGQLERSFEDRKGALEELRQVVEDQTVPVTHTHPEIENRLTVRIKELSDSVVALDTAFAKKKVEAEKLANEVDSVVQRVCMIEEGTTHTIPIAHGHMEMDERLTARINESAEKLANTMERGLIAGWHRVDVVVGVLDSLLYHVMGKVSTDAYPGLVQGQPDIHELSEAMKRVQKLDRRDARVPAEEEVSTKSGGP